MTATLCSIVFLAQSALGCGWGGHHDWPLVACRDVRGVETAEVFAAIRTLQCDPRWRKRDNAAHDLRDFDWRCHPEILAALTTAMLTDREEEVREEAAEALEKIDPPPCTPEVHAALVHAAVADPDHATRKDARQALARIGRHCVAPCAICGPASPVAPLPTEVIIGAADDDRAPTRDGHRAAHRGDARTPFRDRWARTLAAAGADAARGHSAGQRPALAARGRLAVRPNARGPAFD